MTTKEAAAQALATHNALRAVNAAEPSEESASEWLQWHDDYKSAYSEWSAAMDALPDMSRHPFNFRPLCEAILKGEEL